MHHPSGTLWYLTEWSIFFLLDIFFFIGLPVGHYPLISLTSHIAPSGSPLLALSLIADIP